ncbi:hypothetical protein ColLi_12057 [Colletotrichum liriopes]|uniref:Uncharacterized protein n=1 Tax=Colletotrichum liriopes TaxID=708192 RepID=A0AA37GXN7_9PEZI|nr:hypothetical protein ColLi_12057 [Colletotrichum liriopes]
MAAEETAPNSVPQAPNDPPITKQNPLGGNTSAEPADASETQSGLQKEKTDHADTKLALKRKTLEAEELRTAWRQTCNEFNTFKSLAQNKAFQTLEDKDLVKSVSQLGYNVQSFGNRFFGYDGPAPILPRQSQGQLRYLRRFINTQSDSFEALMVHTDERCMVVESIIWKLLVDDVFGQFCWAGQGAGVGLSKLHEAFGLGQKKKKEVPENLETLRKYHIWKARTTLLLVDVLGLEGDGELSARRKLAEGKASKAAAELQPYAHPVFKKKDLELDLVDIIMQALELDLLIHKQAADISWLHMKELKTSEFDPVSMDNVGNPGSHVWHVLSPGVVKRGKSNGEEFETVQCLLKSKVACGPSPSEAGAPHGSRSARLAGDSMRSIIYSLTLLAASLKGDR